MATQKSASVTNLDALPAVHNPIGKCGGRVRAWMETYEVTSTGSGEIIKMLRVPWNLRPVSLQIACDDLGTGTMDIGWYYTDGTVGDVDEFASAVDVGAAAVVFTLELFEAAAGDIDRIGKFLWEYAGLTADPGGLVDIALTVASGTGMAGTLSMILLGTID